MRDKEDERRIKEYMAAKMKHIKMYNECMNLADGLDVEKFAELVRADERQKIEEQFERRIHRQKNNYGKTMQKLLADEREACAKVCEEWGAWNQTAQDCAAAIRARGDAIDISQERVDETAKREREWVGLDDDIPGLGLVTEEFYNGMLCAEDILRKRNT